MLVASERNNFHCCRACVARRETGAEIAAAVRRAVGAGAEWGEFFHNIYSILVESTLRCCALSVEGDSDSDSAANDAKSSQNWPPRPSTPRAVLEHPVDLRHHTGVLGHRCPWPSPGTAQDTAVPAHTLGVLGQC